MNLEAFDKLKEGMNETSDDDHYDYCMELLSGALGKFFTEMSASRFNCDAVESYLEAHESMSVADLLSQFRMLRATHGDS